MFLAEKDRTIPNLLSIMRLALTPFLILAAWNGHRPLFLTLFAAALVSDAADGYLARRLGQTSALGAKLDSWGDCALYCVTPPALWWLWPEIISRERLFVIAAVIAFMLPIAIGLVKYRKLTSYHTIGAKIAAVLLGVSVPLLLLGGPAWPFRLAVLALVIAELEEIAITLLLPEWQSNVLSIRHARQQSPAQSETRTKNMDPRNEMVVVVDADNQITGSVPRHEMRAKGLPHRATYILVFNSAGEIFVQERTTTKDIYPGYLDIATGGVVLSGESYEESAERELAEELGIKNVPLTSHFDFFHEDENNKVWGRVFSCCYDGEVVLQEEEVADGFFMAPPKALKLAETRPFTPDGLLVLRRYLDEHRE